MNARVGPRVVYMGTSAFAVPALETLCAAGRSVCEVGAVVTQPDRARGRGGKILPTPIGAFAETNGLPLLKPERLKDNEGFLREIAETAPDLIVVASYGRILPTVLLRLPSLGCVNIHASLLPMYRGAAPIQRAILDGRRETGVTLMYMDEGLDTGDLIAAAKTEIGDLDAGGLTERLARLGATLLMENLSAIVGGVAARVSQDDARATYAEKFEKEDGHIDLSESADVSARRVRAATPTPGAYTQSGGTRFGVTKARAIGKDEAAAHFPGGEAAFARAYETAACGKVLLVSKKGIFARTGEGVLVIEELKAPGKRAMPVAEYLRGNAFDEGALLE